MGLQATVTAESEARSSVLGDRKRVIAGPPLEVPGVLINRSRGRSFRAPVADCVVGSPSRQHRLEHGLLGLETRSSLGRH